MDDSMRAKARAVFGKEFMDIMKPKPFAKNEAVALQQRANARPIPTYKVGGAVKKPMPKVQKKADGGLTQTMPKVGIEPSGVQTQQQYTQAQLDAGVPLGGPAAPTVAKQPFTVGPATPTQPGFKSPNSPFGMTNDDKKFGGNNNTFNDMKGKQKGQLQPPTIDPAQIAQMMQQARILSQTMQNSPTQPVQAAKKGGKIMAKKSGGKICKKADGGTAASTNEDIRNRYRDMISNEMNPNRAAKVAARQDRRDTREEDRTAREAARTSERAARDAAQAKQRASAEAEAAKQRAAVPAQRPAPNTYASAKAASGSPSGPTPNRPGFPVNSSSKPSWLANAGKIAAGAAGLKKGGKAAKMAIGGMAMPAGIGGNGGPGGTMNPNARRISSGGNSLQDQAAAQAQMDQTIQGIRSMGNPGMKKGGKVKDGLAVMIAIGKAKPVKEKATGEMYASKKAMAKHEAAESAGMQRMEAMKPVKRAAGGAAKVRKGMMTQSGQITPGKRGR